jgi:pilus assembly protein CpaC
MLAVTPVLLAAFLAAAPFGAAPAAAQDSGATEFIELVRGRASTVRLAPFTTVTVDVSTSFSNLVVGKAEVADALPLSSNSLYIQGNGPGRTNISIYDEQKSLIGVIDVIVEMDVSELRRAIASIAPRSNVSVGLVNGQIRLSGEVPDGAALMQIVDVAKQYGGDGVINAIRVTDSQQVMLEVRFLEASRNIGNEIGVGFRGRGDDTRFNVGGVRPIDIASGTLGGSPFSTLITEILDSSGLSVDILVKALEDKGVVRRLAEPNLVALSGQSAGFLAGGEIPVPRVTDGEADVEYKPYGVQLSFTPVVLEKGLVSVSLTAVVSDLDYANGVIVNGSTVPGLISRSTQTTVELRDGQSFSVSGLLQADNTRNIEQVPYLGSVPILGALFRSSSYQKKETDLVVIVTPHIVRPSRPGEALASPLDGKRSSNDPELFLLGMLEVTDDMIATFEGGRGIAGPYGHILDIPVAPAATPAKKP